MIEMSKYVGPWREAIVSECQRSGVLGLRFDKPVSVGLNFYLPRPKSHHGAKGLKPSAPRYPATTPDLDKLIRSSLDALTQAAVFADDALVVRIGATKWYADEVLPGARIVVCDIS
jgi:crossover junction endodeoxyribonuclease RusA